MIGFFVCHKANFDKFYILMPSPDIKQNIYLSKRMWKKIILSLVFLVVFEFICYPVPVLASQADEIVDAVAMESVDIEQPVLNSLPQSSDLKVVKTDFVTVTAYTSEIGQTDGNPCRTANGYDLCKYNIEDTVAANFLPFGTKIKLPDVFGDKVFVVRDRMNSRYNEYVDVWFKDKQEAKRFGIKVLKIEILAGP